MSPVKLGGVDIVPTWFGLEPSEARDVIAQLLERAGGRPSGEDGTSFTLNMRAVVNLRRDGVTIRNRRAVRTSYEAAVSNRAHVAVVRSWIAMAKANVSSHQARVVRVRRPFGLAPIVQPRRPTTSEAAGTTESAEAERTTRL